MSVGSVLRRRWSKIAVDTALLAGFLTEFITREGPDYGLHSWVGIVLVPIIAVHLLGNAGWIRRFHKRPQPSTHAETKGFRFHHFPQPSTRIHSEWLPTWLPMITNGAQVQDALDVDSHLVISHLP